MQRRHRLSRSKDFDAVYRHGTSASTRYLTLYWFPRDEDPEGDPRLGLAVPRSVGSAVSRNRVKRQLREAWRSLLDQVPAGKDYVLAARPGLAELADARGGDWLAGEIVRSPCEGAGVSYLRPRYLAIALVHAWRWTLGLLTPPGTCKYHPSCSQYALDALREFGLVRGTVLAGWRLLRCNPWSHGGVDYAHDQKLFPLHGPKAKA